MDKEPKILNMNDWTVFGGGYTAESYFNKDKTIMMKLYASFVSPSEPIRELEFTEHIMKLGIRCPKSLDFVTDGNGRYGSTFEVVPNKKSFARVIADDPSVAYKMGQEFAKEGSKFHSTECDTKYFTSFKTKAHGFVDNLKEIPDDIRKRIETFIDSVSDETTCLHGDFHMGNILVSNGTYFWIDLGGFAYGNKLFDVGTLFFVTHCSSEEMIRHLYHCDAATAMRFWDGFRDIYFPNMKEEDVCKLVMPYAAMTALMFANMSHKYSEHLQSVVNEAFKGE